MSETKAHEPLSGSVLSAGQRCSTQPKRLEGSIAIPVGAFADPKFPSPTFSVYEERMHSWVSMPPGVEHMA